jgi:hypothetical protein
LDIALYLRVLWRFRILTAAGLGLAVLVGVLSVAAPSFDGLRPSLSYHEPVLWESDAVLLVTQRGFPWGRSTFSEKGPVRFADPGRLTGLALFYAELAKSDAVRSMIKDSLEEGKVEVSTRVATDNATTLPMLSVKATTQSPETAEELALDASRALQTYIEREQDAAGIRAVERVEIVMTRSPREAVVAEKPKLVRPVFLFMLIAIATVGLVFVLENLRPRRPALAVADAQQSGQLRRTQSMP